MEKKSNIYWTHDLDPIEPFFGACSSCLEEKSTMMPNPDPKQYWNNWKNDMSFFFATNHERP